MKTNKQKAVSILLAAGWIGASEFFRNEWLLKDQWTSHFQSRGLVFPSSVINGAMWGLWSLLLATAIFVLAKRFALLQTVFVVWFVAFVMMWVAIGNLGVLPVGILMWAVPLSLLETWVATWIIKKLTG